MVYPFQREFVKLVLPPAKRQQDRTGLYANSVVTLAALETNWGKYLIPNSNNLFNLLDDFDWMGETVDVDLPIKIGDRYLKKTKKFKVYYSLDDSIVDLAIQLRKDRHLYRAISASRNTHLFFEYLRRYKYWGERDKANDPRALKLYLRHKRIIKSVYKAIKEIDVVLA
jgi:flagellar protein FlgJ